MSMWWREKKKMSILNVSRVCTAHASRAIIVVFVVVFVRHRTTERIWIHKYTWIFRENVNARMMRVCVRLPHRAAAAAAESATTKLIKYCEKLRRLGSHMRFMHLLVRFALCVLFFFSSLVFFILWNFAGARIFFFFSFAVCLWSVRTSEKFQFKRYEERKRKKERKNRWRKSKATTTATAAAASSSKKMSRGFALKVN